MKIQDIKAKLNKKKQENNQKIALADERTRMAKANQFEQQASMTLMSSMFYYCLLLIASAFLTKSYGMNIITDIIPAIYCPIIVLGGSLGLGILTNIIQNYKFRIKERIKAFSKAKTESEKIVEEVQYEIECQKVMHHNMAIEQAVTQLNIQDAFSKTMTYNLLADKNTDYPSEELEKNIENLEHLIKERQKNIDTLVTKLVLYNRFGRTLCKSERIYNLTLMPTLGMTCIGLFTNMPVIVFKEAITYSSDLVSLLVTFIPVVLGLIGTTGYLLKRNHNHILAFKQLNSQLGNEAIPDINDKSYNNFSNKKEEINERIAYQIREISTAIVKIHEEEEKLAKLMSSKENEKENEERTECKIKSHEEFIQEEHLLSCDLDEEQTLEKTRALVKKVPHHKRNVHN